MKNPTRLLSVYCGLIFPVISIVLMFAWHYADAEAEIGNVLDHYLFNDCLIEAIKKNDSFATRYTASNDLEERRVNSIEIFRNYSGDIEKTNRFIDDWKFHLNEVYESWIASITGSLLIAISGLSIVGLTVFGGSADSRSAKIVGTIILASSISLQLASIFIPVFLDGPYDRDSRLPLVFSLHATGAIGCILLIVKKWKSASDAS